MTQLLIQNEFQPIHVGVQVCTIYAGTRGYLDKVPTDRVVGWKAAFGRFLELERKALIDAIETDKKWDEDVEARVKEAVEAFNQQYDVEGS